MSGKRTGRSARARYGRSWYTSASRYALVAKKSAKYTSATPPSARKSFVSVRAAGLRASCGLPVVNMRKLRSVNMSVQICRLKVRMCTLRTREAIGSV